MRYFAGLLMVCFVGCVSPTEAMKMNAGVITDTAKVVATNGSKPGDPMTMQLVKNAETNEMILGSPKQRLDPTNIQAQESNRIQAQKDAEGGGFWWMAGASLLGVGSLVTGLLGLSGVSNFLKKQQTNLESARTTATQWEERSRGYAGHLETVVRAVDKYTNKDGVDGTVLKKIIGDKARDAGSKVEFDRDVRIMLE